VWSAGGQVSRFKSKVWLVCFVVLFGYLTVFILMLIGLSSNYASFSRLTTHFSQDRVHQRYRSRLHHWPSITGQHTSSHIRLFLEPLPYGALCMAFAASQTIYSKSPYSRHSNLLVCHKHPTVIVFRSNMTIQGRCGCASHFRCEHCDLDLFARPAVG
jgi:hypothetical protein